MQFGNRLIDPDKLIEVNISGTGGNKYLEIPQVGKDIEDPIFLN
jgi:hypothetical protein